MLRQKLTEAISEDPLSSSHNGIAMANIHRRIQLMYGTMYGMSIRSTPGVGTQTTLLLPLHGADREASR